MEKILEKIFESKNFLGELKFFQKFSFSFVSKKKLKLFCGCSVAVLWLFIRASLFKANVYFGYHFASLCPGIAINETFLQSRGVLVRRKNRMARCHN